jgi:tetratricopeptide (TPR) repeat protein
MREMPTPAEPALVMSGPSPSLIPHPSSLIPLFAFALFAGAVGLYAGSLPYPYTNLDDAAYVGENPKVFDGLTVDNVAWALTTGAAANYHPLTWLSFQLDATVWGWVGWAELPIAYRTTNLLLHGANAALLYLLLRRMTGATGRSFAAAALWAAHPLHVESVVWVTERKDVLSQFFGLLAVTAYCRYVDRPSAGRMAGVAGLMLLSLAGKPMFVTLPALLLVLDFWPLCRMRDAGCGMRNRNPSAIPHPASRIPHWDDWRPLVAEKWPLFAAAVGWSVVAWAVQSRGGATAGNDLFPAPVRVANAAQSYLAYLGQTVWPAGLAPYYPHPSPGLFARRTVLAFAVLAAVTAGCGRLAGSRPYLLAGWLWYLGTLVPVVGFVQVGDQGRADRYTYLPQIGLLVAGVWLFADLVGRRAGAALAVAATAGLSAATVAQARLWEDNVLLWRHALAVTTPDNYKAHECLAGWMLNARRPDAAIDHAHVALGPVGVNPAARVVLGMAYAEQGKTDAALAELQLAAHQAPTLALPRLLLGQMLLRVGRAADALPLLTLTGQKSPLSAAAEAVIAGRELLAAGKPGPAREKFVLAMRKCPGLAEPQYLRGQCAEAEGNLDEAAGRYRDAARILPDYPPPYARLALVLSRQGDHAGAVAAGEKAVALRPGSPVYRAGLGQVLSAAGRAADADAQYAEATKNKPDWADAAADLALTALAGPDPAAGLFDAANQATQACEGTKYGRATPLAALAAVRAAEGRFGAAVELAAKAAGLAGRPDEAAAFRGHAAAYRAGKTLREYVSGGR